MGLRGGDLAVAVVLPNVNPKTSRTVVGPGSDALAVAVALPKGKHSNTTYSGRTG